MAKAINMNDALEKKFGRSKTEERIYNVRNRKVYFLIVCEGKKTEYFYFKSFNNRDIQSYVCDTDVHGEGISTLGLVDKCIKIRDQSTRGYDKVWVVFDKDSFPPGHFNGAIERAKNNNIGCAWSNEAFELWYLLHFDNVRHAMSRRDYGTTLGRKITKVKGEKFKYEKNAPNMYDVLEAYGDQALAIARAGNLRSSYADFKYHEHNPCTMVDVLVQELNGDSEDLLKKIKKRNKKK